MRTLKVIVCFELFVCTYCTCDCTSECSRDELVHVVAKAAALEMREGAPEVMNVISDFVFAREDGDGESVYFDVSNVFRKCMDVGRVCGRRHISMEVNEMEVNCFLYRNVRTMMESGALWESVYRPRFHCLTEFELNRAFDRVTIEPSIGWTTRGTGNLAWVSRWWWRHVYLPRFHWLTKFECRWGWLCRHS